MLIQQKNILSELMSIQPEKWLSPANDEQKTPSLIGDGPLEITGGGVTIPHKEFLQGKLIWKKKSCERWYVKIILFGEAASIAFKVIKHG